MYLYVKNKCPIEEKENDERSCYRQCLKFIGILKDDLVLLREMLRERESIAVSLTTDAINSTETNSLARVRSIQP